MPRRAIRELKEFVDFVKAAGFEPATVIDVGVCYGTPELTDGFPQAYHILFEPVAELEPRMKALTMRYRGEYHMCALGNEAGMFPMTVKEGAVEGATLAGSSNAASTRVVRVETLDGMLGHRNLAAPVLLKTDCQGFDLNVMKGGVNFLRRVDLLVMEVNMFHPAGNPKLGDFGEIVSWMRDHGFSVYDILSYQTRPLDMALGYVDLAFVQNNGQFRRFHRWA